MARKMMCGSLSQVAMLDVSAAILDNSFKTSTPFIDTVINETLWEFLPLSDYRSLQFFRRLELSLVVDSPESMKTTLVFPIRDTPTDTITLRLKCSRSRISTDISSSVCFAR